MTIDDEKSIYVGGLPYDCTEDTIRRAFDIYGSVVAIKINNDREVGGKCYGFVTFTNPSSAIDAINDMNGRTIGGRVVKVNEVRTRGGRSHFNHENFHRDTERDMDWDRGRERGRDYHHDHVRDRYWDRNNDRSRDRDIEREIEYEHPRDHDRSRDRFPVRDHDHNDRERNMSHDRERGMEHDLDLNGDIEEDRSNDNDRKDTDKDRMLKSQSGSYPVDCRSREPSSNSLHDYDEEVKEQLEISIQRHGELQKEISLIEEKLQEKSQLVSESKKRSQKLEDALTSTKKLTSQRQNQFSMLQRCFLQVKDYTEKLKSSEQELQSLVDTAMVDTDGVEEVAAKGDAALHTNVKA